MADENHALVFGATGLLGWGVLEQLLSDEGTFTTVTAVLRRPTTAEELGLDSVSDKLTLADGVDLLADDDVGGRLLERVSGVERTTHVFYFGEFDGSAGDLETETDGSKAFAAVDGEHREVEVNADMMRRVVAALNVVAPRLRSFVYGGGTKQYGIYAPGGTWPAPLQESLAEGEQQSMQVSPWCVYPVQRRMLAESSRGRAWSWTEICPDAVIGFTPFGSAYSLALHWGQYLSLYAREKGAGHGVPFPGSVEGYDSRFTPVSTRTLGRVAIFVGLLHLDDGGGGVDGKMINVADREDAVSFRKLWPEIVAWFDLVGVGPPESASTTTKKPGEYVHLHRALFKQAGKPRAVSCGVGAGGRQLDEVGWWLTFDRHMSLRRLRRLGFGEERDVVDGWVEAFERMREAGIIF
ncbi:hypothetical protein L249_1149 [Ophiocordyceps polyrhachis-furcata BCC 54312]|uniref:PRISE-like Rossmann-fold domain-containing protein n=1 Tax=Ophiocordyceps polyrhachis-furcata BCC 54312 TaxID=1330021 RepID=A0A367LDF7_9HYPO|nr:hypothetical protein L249_1149 [Ophiocordyceps polyrhachis-furcata BCC 54312]